MKKYIGTKQVAAREMTREEYNFYRGWTLPADEDGMDEGYLVEYLDGGKPNHPAHGGYISWSPKEHFDNAHRELTDLTFGMAIEAAKKGKKVARTGWNGAGMFVYYVPAAKYKAQTSVIMDMGFDNNLVPYREYWALKTAQNDVAVWAPSGSDSLAEDWVIIE
jgi:hypothetical protein